MGTGSSPRRGWEASLLLSPWPSLLQMGDPESAHMTAPKRCLPHYRAICWKFPSLLYILQVTCAWWRCQRREEHERNKSIAPSAFKLTNLIGESDSSHRVPRSVTHAAQCFHCQFSFGVVDRIGPNASDSCKRLWLRVIVDWWTLLEQWVIAEQLTKIVNNSDMCCKVIMLIPYVFKEARLVA